MSVRMKCHTCPVRSSAICSAVGVEAARDLGRIVHRMRIPEGRVIYGGNQKARTFGIVISGVVKLVTVKPDGRTQIVGLQFASDFVGRPYVEASAVFAEAATDVELCCFSGRAFEDLLREHADLERVLFKRTLNDLDAARDWMFLLGRKSAQEKVATLLNLIAERNVEPICDCGSPGPDKKPAAAAATMRLPLSRTEIAECLGLRVETVCRQLAHLKDRGVISTSRRRTFTVNDMTQLKRYAETPVE